MNKEEKTLEILFQEMESVGQPHLNGIYISFRDFWKLAVAIAPLLHGASYDAPVPAEADMLISAADAAKMCNTLDTHLYQWAKKGKFPNAVRMDKKSRNGLGFRLSEVQKWIKDPAAWGVRRHKKKTDDEQMEDFASQFAEYSE